MYTYVQIRVQFSYSNITTTLAKITTLQIGFPTRAACTCSFAVALDEFSTGLADLGNSYPDGGPASDTSPPISFGCRDYWLRLVARGPYACLIHCPLCMQQ